MVNSSRHPELPDRALILWDRSAWTEQSLKPPSQVDQPKRLKDTRTHAPTYLLLKDAVKNVSYYQLMSESKYFINPRGNDVIAAGQ